MKKYIIEPSEGKSLVAAMGVTLTKTFDYSEIWNKLIRIDLLWKTTSTFTFTTFNIYDLNGIKILNNSGFIPANTSGNWNLLNSHSGSAVISYCNANAGITQKGVCFLNHDGLSLTVANSGGAMTGEIYIIAYTSEEDSD